MQRERERERDCFAVLCNGISRAQEYPRLLSRACTVFSESTTRTTQFWHRDLHRGTTKSCLVCAQCTVGVSQARSAEHFWFSLYTYSSYLFFQMGLIQSSKPLSLSLSRSHPRALALALALARHLTRSRSLARSPPPSRFPLLLIRKGTNVACSTPPKHSGRQVPISLQGAL